MRGQFDTLTVAERKEVAAAWVAAGKATGLFTIIQCGSTSVGEAAEVSAYVESIGGDGVASVGPFEELCSSTECVVDWVAPVAAAAPKTPFFYCERPLSCAKQQLCLLPMLGADASLMRRPHAGVEWQEHQRRQDVRLVQVRR